MTTGNTRLRRPSPVGRKSRPGAGRTGDGVQVFIVFGIVPVGHLKGHRNVLVLATVLARGPSGWPGHQPGPGRYILGLARRVELELFFVFLFRVFGHGGIIKPTADLVVKAGKEDRPRRR